MKLNPPGIGHQIGFKKESKHWRGIKTTQPKKYPDEFYEFHPTSKLTNPVDKIRQKSFIRNPDKTKLDLKKKEINPLRKRLIQTRNKVNLDHFPSLIEFLLPTRKQQKDRMGRRNKTTNQTKITNSELLALKLIKPYVVPEGVNKNPMTIKQEGTHFKKPGQLKPASLALKLVKPRNTKKQEMTQKHRPIENVKLQKGNPEKYQDVKNKNLAADKKTIKSNNNGVTGANVGGYRKNIKNKTEVRKSKDYEDKSTQHQLSITSKRVKTETKTDFSHRIHNGLQKFNLRKRKGVVTSQTIAQSLRKPHIDALQYTKSSENSEEAVFEFETTVSVSLDSGGYLMTIILISQIIVFGMFLYNRALSEHKHDGDD